MFSRHFAALADAGRIVTRNPGRAAQHFVALTLFLATEHGPDEDTDQVLEDGVDSAVRFAGGEVDDGSVTNISDNHVKVHFRMDIDEGGWPPVSVESLWAIDLGDGTVRLNNTPWFVRGIASNDIIVVRPDDDGDLWAGDTVQPSQHCTIRLIVLKDDGSAAARQSVLEAFHRLGTTGEGIERYRMVALDVPPEADLPKILKLLNHGDTEEWWHWEEGCVTAAWEAAARS